ncbi:HNH endonuclease [Gramella sp. Hel_I_59]|uniref:HNH endonuclease n=1 Tax=Gramella sp. Hel_I_59 TaxID=1249978 RepID=UPI0011526BB1|nr:HNH endonuclease [Gramella sp. Hel_I_59]TQI71139.1 HNH endonuclease [Gramella sp. Hel_I_59]
MTNCIICDSKNDSNSIEHIIPESLGNQHYTLERGELCDKCNNLFSKFENKALSNSVFAMERARLGIKTKKGKTAKGKVDKLEIEGNKDFKKDHVDIKGLDKENFKNYNPKTRIGQVYVKAFDQSENAVSKFLLMVAIESIYKSQKKLFYRYDFKELKEYLTNQNTKDWVFITADKSLEGSKSIPTFLDKYRLKKIKCKLRFKEVSDDILLFNYDLGGISMIINLLNRNLKWLERFDEKTIYPEHFRKKTATNIG